MPFYIFSVEYLFCAADVIAYSAASPIHRQVSSVLSPEWIYSLGHIDLMYALPLYFLGSTRSQNSSLTGAS